MDSFDLQHIWHPYTSFVDPVPAYQVESARGVRIRLDDGRELIDAMASWWSVIHGYNHPALNAAVTGQLDKMAHVMFGGLTHRPAIELGKRLVEVLPQGLDRIFYCDSGSVAVEVAVKMALQCMYARGMRHRNQVATILGGYHGDTWHAMSVCDPQGGMHSLWSGRLPVQFFAPRPEIPFDGEWDPAALEPLRKLLTENKDKIGAVILEPIVQGAGGMRFYHPGYLKGVRALCDELDMLLIADEIATGFGRTGKLFACEWAGIAPDIICLGKGLTGGYMSFAAVVAGAKVAMAISEGSPGEFMHGPTYMGNPLACAVACASIDLARRFPMERIARIGELLEEGLAPARGIKGVADVRTLGAIGVVEMEKPVDVAEVQRRAMEKGVWVRPFGKLVYTMPPFVVADDEIKTITNAIIYAVKA